MFRRVFIVTCISLMCVSLWIYARPLETQVSLKFPLAEWTCPLPESVTIPFKLIAGEWQAGLDESLSNLPSYFYGIQFMLVEEDYNEDDFIDQIRYFQPDTVRSEFTINKYHISYKCIYSTAENYEPYTIELDLSSLILPASDNLPLPVSALTQNGETLFRIPQITLRYEIIPPQSISTTISSYTLHLKGLFYETDHSMFIPALKMSGRQYFIYDGNFVKATSRTRLIVQTEDSIADIYTFMTDHLRTKKDDKGECVDVGRGVQKCGCSSPNIRNSINAVKYSVFDVVYDTNEKKLSCQLFSITETNRNIINKEALSALISFQEQHIEL